MYALNVGVRNEFFSLSCFEDSPDKAVQRAQNLEEAWNGPYSKSLSQVASILSGEDSLVWCRDGANVIVDKHLQDGFFVVLVKESIDSEIKLWKPVPLSTRFVYVDLLRYGYGNGLRMVRPFWSHNSEAKYLMKRKQFDAFDLRHLNWWSLVVANEYESSDYHGAPSWPRPLLVNRKHDVSTTH